MIMSMWFASSDFCRKAFRYNFRYNYWIYVWRLRTAFYFWEALIWEAFD